MKIFAFLLAIMVLVQSVMPCTDTDFGWGNGNEKTELSKATHQKDNQKSDDCSPFCQCACCAGFSLNHYVAVLNMPPAFQAKAQPAILPSDTFEIVLPIWQPPQLLA